MFHDLEVVAVRVQRGERQGLALLTVVAVVVINADRYAPVPAKRLDETLGEGRFAGRAIASDREQHRAPGQRGSWARLIRNFLQVWSVSVGGCAWRWLHAQR